MKLEAFTELCYERSLRGGRKSDLHPTRCYIATMKLEAKYD